MSFGFYLLRNAVDGARKVCDVGADMSVPSCDDFCEMSFVISDDKRQSIQFPRNPDGPLFSPLYEVANLLGLSQRKGSKFVLFLLTSDGVLRNFLRRRVGQGTACLALQSFQFVEALVPFIIGHQLGASIVVGFRSLVQLTDELLHP